MKKRTVEIIAFYAIVFAAPILVTQICCTHYMRKGLQKIKKVI